LRAHQAIEADADQWAGSVSRDYRQLLMAGAVEKSTETIGRDRKPAIKTLRKGLTKQEAQEIADGESAGDISFAKMLRCRIRYFTDGAVIGSRAFVNDAFTNSRHRFGPKRKDGARTMKGSASEFRGALWSMRALQKGII
jgi:hypothetical protein